MTRSGIEGVRLSERLGQVAEAKGETYAVV